jgi:carboxypeptidase PM20D1
MIAVYIILALIGLLVVLLLIALVNTLLVKQEPIPEVTKIDFSKQEEYGKKFSEMIKIKTISYNEETENKDSFIELKIKMQELFPLVFKTMEKQEFKGESLIMKWPGKSSEKPIVLMSHIDVVPADKSTWDMNPFGGKIIGDEIYGRGTLDTKSTVFAFYQACEELLEKGFVPEHDIYLASSTDEETSGFGAGLTVEWLEKRGVKPYLVIDEGGTVLSDALPGLKRPMAVVGVLEKGYVNVKLTAKSFGGHSSTPPKNTPLARLAAMINESFSDEDENDKGSGRII